MVRPTEGRRLVVEVEDDWREEGGAHKSIPLNVMKAMTETGCEAEKWSWGRNRWSGSGG